MPPTLAGQSEYYARHHRRESSMSQSSLPDQLRNSIAAAYSPSRSAVFLPATTFGHNQSERSGSPTFTSSGFVAGNGVPFPQLNATNDAPLGSDPDEYYRQYQNQFGHEYGGPLRQGAIRTADIDTEPAHRSTSDSASSQTRTTGAGHRQAAASHDTSNTPINLPGLRARKSSVKNLVAQINASSAEEVPPIPNNAVSQSESRNISPVISSAGSFQQPLAFRQMATGPTKPKQPDTTAFGQHTSNGLGVSINLAHISDFQTHRRPLFGELISETPLTINQSYVAQDFRRRSGSEGSPVMIASPLSAHDAKILSQNVYGNPSNDTSADGFAQDIGGRYRQGHRRVSSAAPVTSSITTASVDAQVRSNWVDNTRQHIRQQSSTSRIPVSIRRASASSGSELRSTNNAPAAQTTSKRSSPRRRPRTPAQIQSPGSRSQSNSNTQAPKSPLLRANIIAPPPKISPPLRSSRPRLPVSNASTAASRARMAEKFTLMQKMNNEKRAAARRAGKPPELSDIDLKERRLRITQALSRSLEGQDLRGNFERYRRQDLTSSRTASPALSERSQRTDPGDTRTTVPAVVIESDVTNESEREFRSPTEETPTEQQAYTHHAIQAIEGLSSSNKNSDDSPTLGRGEATYSVNASKPQQDFVHDEYMQEPSSAMINTTTERGGTQADLKSDVSVHDPENTSQTLLSHVAHMRSQSPISQRPASSCADLSDNGDQESVHLILRDTTYLDDSEAIRTGYRTASNEPMPDLPVMKLDNRDSWTSSILDITEDQDEQHISHLDSSSPDSSASLHGTDLAEDLHGYPPSESQEKGKSRASTVASDAYTMVNIVLQRHSTNGIVDQQFVDDVYQRVLDLSPYHEDGTLSTSRVEQLCLKEIQDREENWRKSVITSRSPIRQPQGRQDQSVTAGGSQRKDGTSQLQESDLVAMGLPKPSFKSHKYKSSLDSAEDWADTSPSVSDWMRFAHGDNSRKHDVSNDTTPIDAQSSDATLTSKSFHSQTATNTTADQKLLEEDPDMYSAPVPRTSVHTLTTPALSQTSSADPIYATGSFRPPEVPRRITSASQMGLPAPPVQPAAESAKTSIDEADTPEQRRLRRRRHVIKELVDTEFTYEKDLRVLCDIYKQTAVAALNDEDIKVLFGNIEQVQEFSRDFLMLLKQVAKPTYVMERPDRKKDKSFDSASTRPDSSTSTLASKPDNDIPTVEKDRETCIGQAFESSLADMEKIYADYIRNRQGANQRLEVVQKSTAAREWLKECRDNSSDITNAWNLDALLVKPVQRVTKYPLLLRELVEATPDDHPDNSFLKRALHEVTEVNIRINDVKKHAELVDQVLNRKRKDSDVRMGLSKAFGRRAEKLKQHVGIAEMYEDTQYNEVKIHYDNNIVQLMVVSNDCSTYGRAIKKWVDKMVEISSAAEAWVDVGHSNHQEAESKLRQFAMVTRGISTIALPDHIENLERRILEPMKQAVELMNRFKNDQRGLIQKRDKKLIDYAQAKNKKEKGERVDRKMTERMEQWTALNVEAKERMRKLIKATASLVQACQANLIQMQMTWMKMVRSKLSAAMGISLDRLALEDIAKEWQVDFDFQEASALSLSICNGALLAEAVNMATFQTPTTLNGEDSPRQASFSTRRSFSVHSDSSQVNISDIYPRTSGQHSRHQFDSPNDRSQLYGSGFSNGRERATSAASTNLPRSLEPSVRSGKTPKHVSAAAGFAGSSFDRSEEALTSAPRLSVDTPSPYIGSLHAEFSSNNNNNRPPSSSTFFSAPAEASNHQTSYHRPQQSTSSSIFSSAMPMSDSPVTERQMDFSNLSSTAAPQAQPVTSSAPALFTAASVYEFNIDRSRREAGFPYLTYVTGEIFDVIGERGELWLARNQDDAEGVVGWIWEKHFCKLAE